MHLTRNKSCLKSLIDLCLGIDEVEIKYDTIMKISNQISFVTQLQIMGIKDVIK